MVAGKTVGGTVLYAPQDRLTRLEALRLYTQGGAWMSGEELFKGTLQPGKYADLAVLSATTSRSPRKASARSSRCSRSSAASRCTELARTPSSRPSWRRRRPEWSPVTVFGGYYAAKEESK